MRTDEAVCLVFRPCPGYYGLDYRRSPTQAKGEIQIKFTTWDPLVHVRIICRKHAFAPSRRTARVPRPIPGSLQCQRQTMNTMSWRRTLLSPACKFLGLPGAIRKLLARKRGSFPYQKLNVCMVFNIHCKYTT